MQDARKQFARERFQPRPRFAEVVFVLTLGFFICTLLCTASSFLPLLNYGMRGIILTPESLSIDGLTLSLLLLLCGLVVIGASIALLAGLLNVRQDRDNRAARKFLPWSLALFCMAFFVLSIFMTVRSGCPAHPPQTGGSSDDIWYCSWAYHW